MRYSACLEWLFAREAPNFADRIRSAYAAGLDGVEFWSWSDKDLDSVEQALGETGLPIIGFVVEPMIALTDPASHEQFLEGLLRSVAVARRLGAPILIGQAGAGRVGQPRAEQRDALTVCLQRAASLLKGTGVAFAVEPLNTLVDHKGYFLPFTPEALDIIDDVGRPEIGILYDIYHTNWLIC